MAAPNDPTRIDDFCRIFLNTSDEPLVRSRLSALLGGEFQRRTLALDGMVLDVTRNPDRADVDDFVRWPLHVEAEKTEASTWDAYVSALSEVLTHMWDAGIPAVAACDFEDRLPWNGGIARLPS